MVRNVCILGSTGSIGCNTVDVIQRHPDLFVIKVLTAHKNVKLMFEQCQLIKPETVVMVEHDAANSLRALLTQAKLSEITVLSGYQALEDVAQDAATDIVMAAIVGASGLLPTLAAVKAGKRVLLANKEALVMSGEIFMSAVTSSGAELMPVDSEHNAIFQCLPHQQQKLGHCRVDQYGISKILLTGSGGPFRTLPLSKFEQITPEQACLHPNWDMGKKISVDSATMMNKGLEFIEAKWLFNLSIEQISVVLHPQSTIHSMVQYVDGSVIAQLGNPDMRTPIAHALAYPHRIVAGVKPLDFFNTASFEFDAVDYQRYPNLKLAMDACLAGQEACTVLNAANEIAVQAFLEGKIKFTQIYQINETSVQKLVSDKVTNIFDVIELDKQARNMAQKILTRLGC